MTRDEAVQKLATMGRLSIAHAEDLYDSFFEKPVVPQYVADWYEEHKYGYDYKLWDYFTGFDYQKDDDFKNWTREDKNQAIITLVNMHQFGYTVGEETKYIVKVKGVEEDRSFLGRDKVSNEWFFSDDSEVIARIAISHTRKELEDADFGWVFDCPGVEVKEVE